MLIKLSGESPWILPLTNTPYSCIYSMESLHINGERNVTAQDDPDKHKKWYTQVTFWVIGTILAGVAAFVSTRVVSLLESGVEQIDQPLAIVAEPSHKCSPTARKVILKSPDDVPPEPYPDTGPPELHSYDPDS